MSCRCPDRHRNLISGGFSLLEILIAIFLSTLLITAIAQLMSASLNAYRVQLEKSQMEESGRYARDVLVSHISQAGFHPQPWNNEPGLVALTNESLDGPGGATDQLGLQRLSRYNCFGNENTDKDGDGRGRFYLLQAHFQINRSNNLAMTCRYGMDSGSMVTQIRNFGVIENVENLQVLYAEDLDGDNIADRWVRANYWQNENRIVAIKVGLLIHSNLPFGEVSNLPLNVLDETLTPVRDGRLRKVSQVFSALRGRLE